MSFESKSQSPSSNPNSHSIDPVLARYHAIKRQMEDNGGSIYGTPPPGASNNNNNNNHNNPSRSGITPRRSGLGSLPIVSSSSTSVAPSLTNNTVSTRFGTPAPGPSQPAPPPSLSLYTAVLTPDAKRGAAGPSTLNFQKAFTTSMTSPSTSSYNNSNQQQAPPPGMELEAERRRTKELDETRRQLAVERDRQRERTCELEDRLKIESAATAEAASHVHALKSEADRSSRLIESLHLDLVARNNEITALRERQMHLERKLLDAEAELVGGAGGTSHKALTGKVGALENLLKTKQMEIEEELRRSKISELKLDEEREKSEQLQQAVQKKDREIGELAVSLRDAKRLKEKSDLRVNESEIIERELEGKVADLEDKLRGAAESAEVEIRQHKDELRQKAREVQRQEVTITGLQEEVKELAAAKIQLEKEVDTWKQTNQNSNREAKTWQARQEALSVLQASETAAKEDAQREVKRLKGEHELLHDELRAHVKQCEQYERLLSDADSDREIKDALEAQVRVIQASFARQEEDLKSLQLSLESEQRRNSTLEEQASKVVPLERKAAECEALAHLRLQQIDKMRQRESLLESELASTSEQLRTARGEAEDARREFVMAHERCVQLQGEIVALEGEMSALGEAEERLARLNDAYEQRQAQVSHLQIEVASWQSRFREADAEATNLRSVQLKLQSTEDKLAATQEQVAQRDDTIKVLERKISSQQTTIRDSEDDRQIFANEKATLAHEIARLNGFVSDKQALESRLRGCIAELQVRQDELNRERNRIIDLQSRLHERDDAATQERHKRGEFETLAHNLQGEVSKMQMELGRVAVLLDSSDKEKLRLEQALELRTREFSAKQDLIGSLERSLQEKDEELRVKAITDNNVRHEIELSELKMRELRAQLDAARRSVDEQKEVARKAEVERRDLQSRTENVQRMEDKLSSTEVSLVAREDEIASLHQQSLLLKQKIKDQQSEIANLRQHEQRVIELKALLERQSSHLDQAEKEDASKSSKLIEKERELGRVREKLATATGELDSERLRRSQAEATAHELELASSKAVQLEGQLAGLNQILSQRSKDLDEARALVSELRERLRNVGASSASGIRSGSTGVNLATAETDAKLRAKDETIARLEAEEQRRRGYVDQLRRDLQSKEAEKSALERHATDLQTQLDRAEVSWRARCTRLEHELGEMAKRNPASDSRFRRLEDELLDAKVRNQTLQGEVEKLKQELVNQVAHGGGPSSSSSDHNSFSISRRHNAVAANSTTSRSQNEMNRSRASLEGIHREQIASESSGVSPEPKRRTVRSVLTGGGSVGVGGGRATFLNNNNVNFDDFGSPGTNF